MHPYHHAVSSARKHGGDPEDYLAIHQWFDEFKEYYADFRHRAMRHHAQGIFECERLFGVTIINSVGDNVPVRLIAEQHVREDCGRIPSLQDWLSRIKGEPWMFKNVREDREPPHPKVTEFVDYLKGVNNEQT